MSNSEIKTEILTIEIGDLTIYPENDDNKQEMRFSIEPGKRIENALIRVKTEIRSQITGRVVSADGTPITDAFIIAKLYHIDQDGNRTVVSNTSFITDAEGYFFEKIGTDKKPKYYMVGIEHEGYLATASRFILHEGQPEVHLLLKLNDKPIPENERTHSRVSTEITKLLNPPPVWVLNPENGHSYKKVYFHNIEDATAQANAEKAYIVSINDSTEENWIKHYVGRRNILIGLSDIHEEGRWTWHSGEPITYTNWLDDTQLAGNTDLKNYVVRDIYGKWRVVEKSSSGMTILERANLIKINKSDSKQ